MGKNNTEKSKKQDIKDIDFETEMLEAMTRNTEARTKLTVARIEYEKVLSELNKLTKDRGESTSTK